METTKKYLQDKYPHLGIINKVENEILDFEFNDLCELLEEFSNQSKWISVETELPEDGEEVIGFSEKWIHPDFNIEGTRVCFINMGEWISAKWNNDQDSWHTHADWCCGDNGGQDFNPTHWQHKPKRP